MLKWVLGGITLALAAVWPRRAASSVAPMPGGVMIPPVSMPTGPGVLHNAGGGGGFSPYNGTGNRPAFNEASALRLPSDRWQPPSAADPYLPQIRVLEASYGFPRNLLASLLYQESRFRPEASNPSGAKGIAQIIPRWHPEIGGEAGALNPSRAIPYAAKILNEYRQTLGSWELALAAYNRGITATRREGLRNLPAETAAYIPSILGRTG